MKYFLRIVSSFSICLFIQISSFAVTTVLFQEDFASDSALWTNFDNSALLSFNAAGGPDGSSYASGSFNFLNSVFGDQGPVVFRGETTPGGPASGGNFFGNWIADGVREFSAFVRHDSPVPLTFFTRLADSVNFPARTAVQFAPVFGNTWTDLNFSINPSSPNFVTFEGESFATVFDNIGRMQIGVSIPAGLAGVDQNITFDLDQVAIKTPEPTTLLLSCLGALLGLSRRSKFCR